jgi:hypothetical protein
MGTAIDTLMVVCCPCCMAGIEFRPMIGYKDGRRLAGLAAWP